MKAKSSAEERSSADWAARESALRSTYREWASHRVALMMRTLSENPAELPRVQRIETLASAAETAQELATEWCRSSHPAASLRRAQMLAEYVQRRETVDDFLAHVRDLMECELTFADNVSADVREAMAHDESSHRYLRHSTHLRQYEYRLPHVGVPSNVEALVETALYAIYVAQSPSSRILVPDTRRDLVRALSVSEEMLRLVTPRRFEEMVAYIYELLGCRAVLTQNGRDWGADILAWQPGPFGTECLIAVQVKLYPSGRRVDLGGVHGLHGAVTHYNAHHGHLVATADLTHPATEFMNDAGYHFVDLAKLRREIERLVN